LTYPALSLDPASTRHVSFSRVEKTYLSFFATGDLNVQAHGRKTRAVVSTTHPAMLEHVLDTFGPYRRNYLYPATNPSGYGWRLACDLPTEFEFLRTKALVAPEILPSSSKEFVEGLSGFGDAEGHVGLSRSGKWARGRFKVSNRAPHIIWSFNEGLGSMGFRSRVYVSTKNGASQYELEITGDDAIVRLPMLRLRHPEKVAAKQLVLRYHGSPWGRAEKAYQGFRDRITRQRDEFVKLAEIAYKIWPLRKAQRDDRLKRRVSEANTMRTNGFEIRRIVELLGCSERTVYRYLAAVQSNTS